MKYPITVIAGGASTIGNAIVDRIALAGANVVITDINLISAEILVQRIRDKYRIEAAAYPLPLKLKDIPPFLELLRSDWGVADVWVNNNCFHQIAGISDGGRLSATIRHSMEMMCEATREVTRLMTRAGRVGCIINVIPGLDRLDAETRDTLLCTLSHNMAELAGQLQSAGIRLFMLTPGCGADHQALPIRRGMPCPDEIAARVMHCIQDMSAAGNYHLRAKAVLHT